MRPHSLRLRFLLLGMAVFLAALSSLTACHLTKVEEDGNVFSFPSLPNALAGADSATILLKDTNNVVIDTLFQGPVTPGTSFRGLKAEHYQGGQVVISIEGTRDGALVYKEDRRYDGDKQDLISTHPVLVPHSSIAIQWPNPRLSVGDTRPLPTVAITPENLADRSLHWKSRDESVLAVSAAGLEAMGRGTTHLVAILRSDTAKKDSVLVEVVPLVRPPVDSLRILKRSLEVYAIGAAESLVVLVHPPQADPEVVLTVEDRTLAHVVGGKVQGLKDGETWLRAHAKSDPAKSDSIRLSILPSETVQSVTLEPKALNLYLKGESKPLTPTLLPSTLSLRFLWRSSDTSVARVDDAGKVSPGKAGMAYVSVLARADSGKRDSALVTVKKDTPRLQVGQDTVIAAGSTVTFRPAAPQDYGNVVLFKWDLNGDGTFEDSATDIRSSLSHAYATVGEFGTRFYARDTEGNDTTVLRKVTVVTGRVVQFHSPANGAFVNKTPVDVTWSVDGARQTSAEPLVVGPNTITRTAQDAAGNTYTATLIVNLDLQPPEVLITSPEAGMLTRQATVPVAWTVDGTPQTTRNTESLAGKQGRILLIRDALDAAGNRGLDTVAVFRDTVAPAAVAFVSPTSPAVVNAAHTAAVQWAWTRTGEAADSFLVSLNGAPAVRQGGTSYVLAISGNQSYTLQVQEVDAAGNVSAAVSRMVQVDRAAPPAPVVSGATPTGSPTWNWSAGSGSDGARVYRYRLAPTTAYSAEGAAASYSPAGLASGTHTLFVQERDAAGNWSTDGSHALVVDRTGPTLTISGPSEMGRVANFNPQVTGTVDDAHGVRRVEYRINAAAYLTVNRTGENWNFIANYNTGANILWVRGEDNFGNRDSIRITIYKYPQVVFVRKGATGSGKSWEDAFGELHHALAGTISYTSGSQIWVTKGHYEVLPAIGDRFLIPWSNFGILGGFEKDAPSGDTAVRDFSFGATSLGSRVYVEKTGGYVSSVRIDGFTFMGKGTQYLGVESRTEDQEIIVRNIKVRDLLDDNGILNLYSSNNRLENCEFEGNDWSSGVGVTLGTSSKVLNCSFVNNITSGYSAPIEIRGALEVRGGVYRENYGDGVKTNLSHFSISNGQILDINNAVIQGGEAAIHRGTPPGGTLFYGTGNREN